VVRLESGDVFVEHDGRQSLLSSVGSPMAHHAARVAVGLHRRNLVCGKDARGPSGELDGSMRSEQSGTHLSVVARNSSDTSQASAASAAE
jgi:hypothetical protein